ncbi:hypothetical protein VaNZ11_000704 [Volvox africanus]|uniref:Calponin-homology (CH) domain-containing protein n=1 Tax=Volvox africanus TaxID=51714 RepID=A0ABQ5RMY4_9CHLO|nr:hypothetical protein VaNZ11_000704 [Volvox africanus]
MTDEIGLSAQELVQNANKVIVYAGLITRVANIEEVRAVCSSSSLLVAALECFLGRRLEDVLRTPKSPAERAYNINYVVDVLSQLLNCDLSHISGERVVEGSIEDIANILELLAVVCHGRPLQGPPPAHGHAHRESEVSDKQATSLARAPGDGVAQSHGKAADPRQYLGEWLPSDGSVTRSGDKASVDYSDRDADGRGGGGGGGGGVGRSQQRYPLEQDGDLSSASEACAARKEQQPWPRSQQQQLGQRDEGAGHHSDGFQQHQQLGQDHKEASRERRRRGHEASASLPVRVRPRGSGRRQRVSLRRAVVTAQIPLSPIQEVSREGWETTRGSKETPRFKAVDAAMRCSSGSSRAAPHPAGTAVARSSTDGGSSSVISVPSVAQDASRRSSGDPRGSGSRPQQSKHHQLVSHLAAVAANSSLSRAPSSCSEGTSTLLERALSQAEATLRGLGREYEKFYYENDEDRVAEMVRPVRRRRRARKDQSLRQACANSGDGQVHGLVQTGGPSAYEPARRALRAAPWPDSQSGRIHQHEAFLRRAKYALTDGRSATTRSVDVRPMSVSGSQSRMGSRSSKQSAAPLSRQRSPAARAVGAAAGLDTDKDMSSSWRGSWAGGVEAHEDLVRALRGDTARATDMAGQARKLMHCGPTVAYGLHSQYEGTEKLHDADAVAGIATNRHADMQLNPELEAKLRYLYKLTAEDSRHSAARAAVESMAMANDLLRQARRRALVDRLNSARARRDAALRQTADRLREQGRAYNKRMEQLRLQRLAAEWSANQRSAQMRRALQAELALRDAFMEVLQSEKEVLLAERQEAKAEAAAAFPGYKKALRKAESYHREILLVLENLLASERQQRIRADREAEQAQRDFNNLAASMVQDRLRELLGRVAREDEATILRHSIATQPKAKRALVAQIQRVLGLT